DAARRAALTGLGADDLARRFDLERPPLVRFTLVRLAEDTHRLLFTHHHIVLDGWSGAIVVGELFDLYAARDATTALPPVTPYRDYLAWLAGQDRDAAAEAWRTALDGLDEPTLAAPPDPTRVPVRPESHTVTLPADVTAAITAQARRLGLTRNTVAQGAWGLALCGLTGRQDVVFGETVNGRPPQLPGVERMVGLFVNTLPVRVRATGADSLLDVLTRLQNQQSDLMPYKFLGLAEIQRLAGTGELFDTAMVFENFPVDVDGIQESAKELGVVDGSI